MVLCLASKLARPRGFVYVLACKGGKLYVGFSTKLHERLKQHFAGLGAEFTKRNKPVRLLEYKPADGEAEEFLTWKYYAKRRGLRMVGGWNEFLCSEFGFTYPSHYPLYTKKSSYP